MLEANVTVVTLMRSSLCMLAAASLIVVAAAKPKPTAKDRRTLERELSEMAELAESVGETDKAIAAIDELRELCKKKKGPSCETKDADLLEQLGWLCLKSKACADRRAALLAEIEGTLPSKTDLMRDLKEAISGKDAPAEEHEDADEPKKTIPALREHLRTHPDDWDARSDLADLLMEAGQKLEAITELERYLSGRPSDLDARMNLIDALRDAGRRGRALEEIAKLLKDKPRAWKLRELQIELLAEDKSAELDRAIASLCADAPTRAMSWVLAAERRMEKDDAAEATTLLRRAQTISSTEADTLQRIAELERDLLKMRRESTADFVHEVHHYDLEDDLRYGGEIE
jgi:predicted Zn-dependent protease